MLPEGNLNLQQIVRELEKRVVILEEKLTEPVNGPEESPSTPEPPKAD